MTEQEARKLASDIAEDLFSTGNFRKAERLVLTSADGRDMGGWGKAPVVDLIFDYLMGKRAWKKS